MSFEFTFENTPWENLREELRPGDRLGAAAFLTCMEGETEDALEEAFQVLEALEVTLELRDLPKAPGTGEAALRLRMEEKLAAQGELAAGLDSEDPLRLYLEELARIPVCGDAALLSGELAQANLVGREDAPVRARLADLSLSRVVELAREYVGRGVLLLDLIQEGSMGLWQGILSYTSGDFEEIRDRWIRRYMVRAVVSQARQMGVGQRLLQAMEDYRSVDQRLLSELGRNPTTEEIAEQMHVSPQEVEAVGEVLESARAMYRVRASREAPREEPEEARQAVEDTAYFQSRQRIGELLSRLDPRDAELLTLRFGLEGGQPMSPQEIGRRMGMTPEQVSAREAAALAALRN